MSCSNLTEDTLKKLIGLVREQRLEPLVRRTAENIIGNVPEKNWPAEIEALVNFVKKSVRYTRDIQDVEYVKTPLRHLTDLQTYGISYGDCDDMSTLLAALLNSVGYKVRFVIIRTKTNPNPNYNHIFVEVFVPATAGSPGRWAALDATMKNNPYDWTPQWLMRKEYLI